MGGVCSGGTVRRNRRHVDVEHVKSSGFSGKLKSVGSFGKQKRRNEDEDDDEFSFPGEVDGFKKAPRGLFDSGELFPSMSSELKSSTPARTSAYKVYLMRDL